jgi:catechol 2,3-dioxygenase-like lactoylglutathione lyase family enzyme
MYPGARTEPPVKGGVEDRRVGIEIEAIHHVCLVVRNREAAEGFYMGVLGLERHHKIPFWLVLNDRSTLHLVPLPDADDSRRLKFQHFALQVRDLREVLKLLLRHGHQPFQSDFQSNRRVLTTPDESLDFGTGTLFTYDPEGNLVEFLQLGRGLFTEDMSPRARGR